MPSARLSCQFLGTIIKLFITDHSVLYKYSDFRPFDRERRLSEAAEFGSLAEKLRNQDIVPGEDATESVDTEVC